MKASKGIKRAAPGKASKIPQDRGTYTGWKAGAGTEKALKKIRDDKHTIGGGDHNA